MRTIAYVTVDKSGWGDGPWQLEPDKKQWEDEVTGLPCLIVRNTQVTGSLCGYVGVPQGHPLYGKSDKEHTWDSMREHMEYSAKLLAAGVKLFEDEEVGEALHAVLEKDENYDERTMGFEVHGGITFVGPCQEWESECEGVCHVADAGDLQEVWWFGFDCAHAMDLSPRMEALKKELNLPGFSMGKFFGREEQYRTLEYVEAEIRSLALQLAQYRVRNVSGRFGDHKWTRRYMRKRKKLMLEL